MVGQFVLIKRIELKTPRTFFVVRPLDHATIEMKSAGARIFARQTQNQSAEGNQAYFDNQFVELMKDMVTKKGIDTLLGIAFYHSTKKRQHNFDFFRPTLIRV